MSEFLWLDSTEWTAITALATAALVIVGGLTIISAGIDSRARSRPVVIPELRLGKHAERIDLVVTNYGPSMAHNVRLRFSDEFTSVGDNEDIHSKARRRLINKYANRIPAIGPGQVERNTWIHGQAIQTKEHGAPKFLEAVEMSYDGPSLWNWVPGCQKRYKTSFSLDVESRLHDTASSSSLDLEQQMNRVISALEEGSKQLATIADRTDLEDSRIGMASKEMFRGRVLGRLRRQTP